MLYELFLPLGIFMWPHQSTKWHLKGPLATPKCYTLSSLIVYSCCYHGENVNWSRINSTWVTSSHHERNHVISPTQSILPYTVGKHNILHHRLTCMYCAAVVAVPMHELLHACCCPQQCYSIHFLQTPMLFEVLTWALLTNKHLTDSQQLSSSFGRSVSWLFLSREVCSVLIPCRTYGVYAEL